ncbi:hypothetical protein Ancab_024626 [Ancistrocladus abbreviatus]
MAKANSSLADLLMKLACGVAILMVVAAPLGKASDCYGAVCKVVGPPFIEECGPYVQAQVESPSDSCCKLLSLAQSSVDRSIGCSCFKAACNKLTYYNWNYTQTIQQKCNVNLQYTISRGFNCSSIQD